MSELMKKVLTEFKMTWFDSEIYKIEQDYVKKSQELLKNNENKENFRISELFKNTFASLIELNLHKELTLLMNNQIKVQVDEKKDTEVMYLNLNSINIPYYSPTDDFNNIEPNYLNDWCCEIEKHPLLDKFRKEGFEIKVNVEDGMSKDLREYQVYNSQFNLNYLAVFSTKMSLRPEQIEKMFVSDTNTIKKQAKTRIL